MKKNKFFLISLILLVFSCTIIKENYAISNEMKVIKTVMRHVARNPFVERKDLLEFLQNFSDVRYFKLPNNSGYEYREEITDDLKMHIIENKNSDKVIYLLHGGAFITGLYDFYKDIMYYISSNLDEKPSVYMLDYSVYPSTYPKAHDEALNGYKELLKRGYDPKNIVIIGDSAGGHLAVSLMHKLKDLEIERPKALVLFSPWLDIDNKVKSREYNIHNDAIIGNDLEDKKMTEELKNPSYFKNADKESPYVNPLKGDFKDFPYVYFQADKTEMLLGDSIELNNLIRQYDGNKVYGNFFEGAFHDFQILGLRTEESKKALDLSVNAIKYFYSAK